MEEVDGYLPYAPGLSGVAMYILRSPLDWTPPSDPLSANCSSRSLLRPLNDSHDCLQDSGLPSSNGRILNLYLVLARPGLSQS